MLPMRSGHGCDAKSSLVVRLLPAHCGGAAGARSAGATRGHMTRTWFITGTSRGFGREWAEAALERSDSVAATARVLDQLAPLVSRYGD
jgi:hypothetical protein